MLVRLDTIAQAVSRPVADATLPGAREAAVAALITPSLEVVLIRRAEYDRDPWSGHVSLPGGGREPDDPDAVATALRETHEELGVEVPRAALLGPLEPVPTRPGLPQLVIRPFVFALAEEPTWRPNREVAAVHRLSLDALLRGEGRGRFTWERGRERYVLPRVDFSGERLWGLTLHILDDLLHRLDGRGIGLARPLIDPEEAT